MTGDCPVRSVRIPVFGGRVADGGGGNHHSRIAAGVGAASATNKNTALNGRGVHTVALKCQWKDQGWGNRKGRLFVIGKRREVLGDPEHQQQRQQQQSEDQFDGGRVVFKSDVSPHTFESLEVHFSPQMEEDYYLWYVVGGGGGHLLMIEDFCVCTLAFDSGKRTLRDAYAKLCGMGVIGGGSSSSSNDRYGSHDLSSSKANRDLVFYANLLKKFCEAIDISRTIDDASRAPHAVQSFFEKYRLSLDASSIDALTCICNFNLQFLHHYALPIGDDIAAAFRPVQRLAATHEGGKESVLPRISLMSLTFFDGDGDNVTPSAKPCCRIPIIPGRTSRVQLKIDWSLSQGTGISEAKLFVVAVPLDRVTDVDTRYVWESPLATHESTELEMSFVPNEGEVYYVYQQVGGVGLFISPLRMFSITMQLTVRDNQKASLERQYQKLLNHKALDPNGGDGGGLFHTELLLTAIESLHHTPTAACKIHNIDDFTSCMRIFLARHFPVHDAASLGSLCSLVQSLVDARTPQVQDETRSGTEQAVHISPELRLRMYAAM